MQEFCDDDLVYLLVIVLNNPYIKVRFIPLIYKVGAQSTFLAKGS